ncbi:MAG: hypothetical protein IPO37_02800 [Saprospiraceae bacterium]|nr:hypothetical protein [Leptospiraceae bacterium]MBK9564153.1 hypothetical protein [Saprospiraceae bacterium]
MRKKNTKKSKKPWNQRNEIIEAFNSYPEKIKDKKSLITLLIAREIEEEKTYLRLKKFRNWLNIFSNNELISVVKLLESGSKRIKWKMDKKSITDIQNITDKKELEKLSKSISKDDGHKVELDNEELSKILSSIDEEDNEYIVNILDSIQKIFEHSEKKLKVAFEDVISKISKKENQEGIGKLSDLMSKWNLLQISNISNMVKHRLDTIDRFEKLILSEKTYEIRGDNSIHRMLEKNMWLIDEELWIVQSNKSLRELLGDKILKKHKDQSSKRPDFACINLDSNQLKIIEIKKPSLTLTKTEIDQAENYMLIAEDLNGKGYDKITATLIGNQVSEDARRIIKNRKNIDIITYTDFLQKVRKRYGSYLKKLDDI